MIIAIDGGTSNTRVVLIDRGVIKDKIKLSVGAGNYGGTREDYIKSIASAIGKFEKDAEAVVLSGMIGSERGIVEVPHIPAPAGMRELHGSMLTAAFPEITSLPLYFIRGVKAEGDLLSYDIMRGEETEIIGLCAVSGISDGMFLLPGSHNKIVDLQGGKIVGFTTAMSGELLRAAAEHTVISSGLEGGFTTVPDPEYVKMGFTAAEALGVNGALFKSRILERFICGSDEKQRYSFILGAVLYDDVMLTLKKAGTRHITVSGSEPFKSALYLLLKGKNADVSVTDGISADSSSAVGAELIYSM